MVINCHIVSHCILKATNHGRWKTRKCFRTCYEINAGRFFNVAESIVLSEIVTLDNPYVRLV